MDHDQILTFIEYAKKNNAVRIKLSNLNLSELPKEISILDQLEELFLYSNQLRSLPKEIEHLVNLIHLDLRNNKFEFFPDEIAKLTKLKTLRMNDNKINANEFSRIDPLTRLEKLHIRSNGLNELPVDIAHLAMLAELDISNNNLNNLPNEFSKLEKLTILYIGNNKFLKFPLPIARLPQLRELHFQNNLLEYIPPEIGQNHNLTFLNLEGSRLLHDFPIEFAMLSNLSILNLGKSGLTTLPKAICQLLKLTELYLHQNRIVSLPPDIGNLTNLITLDLASNELAELPEDIQRLTELKYLDLRGNPLPIPPEILEKRYEPKFIINYYMEHVQSNNRLPINEGKLLFIGQGSVGKTSLVNRLLYNTFENNQSKTEGITINRWFVDGQEKTDIESKIRLNIWDFGGQEIMHATHQFFLTKRSLYLLVLDTRLTQEENRVEYWLKIIQSFGGNSPVLIIGNKIDQHPLDIDRTGLRKKYSNVIGILEVSAATGTGIEDLKMVITDQVNNLPHIRDSLPKSWFTVKTELEKLGQKFNFITIDEYLKICSENSLNDEISQRTLISFLHDLGVVLYFQDDPHLEAFGILNPEWVTNGVYRILNDHALFQNKGVLNLAAINDILHSPEYPRDKRLFIVDIMKKFELCYEINENTFLVPDLLPKDEPYTGDWTGALAFQYHYNVLPASIISRFIVRMHTFVYKTVWRSGVMLKSGGNMALIKADAEDRKIYIWVSGDKNTKRDFLAVIRTELDAIHRTIAQVEATEKVPLPEYPDVIFGYRELLQFEHDGIFNFPKLINGKSQKISVQQLLDGVAEQDDRRRELLDTHHSKHESVAIHSTITPSENKTLSRLIIRFVFVTIPTALRRLFLDILGRDKANKSTAIMIGYIVVVIGILIGLGLINATATLNAIKDIWRFFFPLS